MSDNLITLDDVRNFRNSASGRWAGERFLAALERGEDISPALLRTCDTLRKDEWIHLDSALVEEGHIRLRGIADLIALGLTIPVSNALGTTIFQWEKVSDMNPAEVSLSGVMRTEDDRQEFTLGNLPLPIIHKDFNISMRQLRASRKMGESLDTSQVRVAGRLVSEMQEYLLFRGGRAYGGHTIYGYTTYTYRNEIDFATAGEGWAAAGKTGEEILTDVLNMITAAENDRFYGPYGIYVPSAYRAPLEEDFKANSDKTVRQRLMEVDGIQFIKVVDQLPADNVILVQLTQDVVALVDGEPLQSIQWDIEGGFIIKFKAFCIQIPLIRSDAQNRCGVVHMHAL